MTIKEAQDAMRKFSSGLATFLPLYVTEILISSLALRKLLQKIQFFPNSWVVMEFFNLVLCIFIYISLE